MKTVTLSRQTAAAEHYRRLIVEVGSVVDIDRNVFLYRQLPMRAGDTEPTGRFEGVCSPNDMADHPVGLPTLGASPPWFRLDTVDLLLRSEAELQSAWLIILEEVQSLVDALNILEETTTTQVFTISNSGGLTAGCGLSIFLQATPSETWVIPHNLGRYVEFSLHDLSGNRLDANYNQGLNTLTVMFDGNTVSGFVLFS